MAADRQELVGAAEKLVNRGRIRAAIEQYRKILEIAADDTSTLNRVGDLYVRIGRLDKAIELFQTTSRQFVRQGFLVKAIAILKKILRLDPTLMEVYERLADLYERQGLVNDARGQYEVVADYYRKHGDLQRSVGIHHKLVDLEPDDPTHRLRLAELYEEQDRSSGAMEQYRGIARLMLAQGQVSDAVRVSLKAVELNPEDLGFLAALIQDFNDSGQSEEAKRLVARAAELNPAAEGMEDLAREEEAPVPDSAEASDQDVAGGETTDVQGPLSKMPGPGKVEVWTSEGDGQGDPEVDLLDLEDLSIGGSSQEISEEPPPVTEMESASIEEFEFDLDDIGVGPGPMPVLETPESIEPPETLVPLPDLREAEPHRDEPQSERSVDELFSEAEVLQRYGLEDKAADRLEELLGIDSRHLGALTRLVNVYVQLERRSQAGRTADQLRSVARQLGVPSVWEEAREALERNGFPITEYLPEDPSEPSGGAVAPEIASAEELEVSPDEVELDVVGGDFFDLASELEAELDQVEAGVQDLLVPIQEEQSLEEIVAGFRRGMQETLSAEDYETHFNLGIAYREMELIDEAIGEFQLAAKEPRHLIECCSLLATCFVAKGLPELAAKWYERGLDSPGLSEQERLGLLYELGDLHLDHGDLEKARGCFVEIYGVSSSFRDVVARIRELDTRKR